MGAIKATDGSQTNPLKEQKIDELGSAMAELFSKQYHYMTPKEQIKTFFAAIQMNAHMFSGECKLPHEHDDLASFIESEAKYTVKLSRSFLS